MENNCVFCKIIKGKISEKKIYENDNFFSIPDINPFTPGHSLVISKKHFKTFLDLPNSLGTELIDCIKKTSLRLIKDYNASGFNIINNNFESAQQIVKHVHFHILPRKKNDGEIKFIKKD
tara:strand:+ start:597 stop:956 length:360 start_codon:yes stop_codon:yes gene_type:complete